MWVEVNLRDSGPIADGAGPTIRVGMTGCGIHLGAFIKKGLLDFHMALGRCDKADGAMAMLLVVPAHQLCHPAPRLQQAIERFDGQLRPVLQCLIQGL